MRSVVNFVVITLFFPIHVNAHQLSVNNESGEFKAGLEGMLGFSFGKNFYSMNVGGPGLYFVINKNLKMGIGAFPSLYVLNGNLGARLGVSPRIDFKNLVLITPFFHRDRTDEWIWSVGFGYKFHRTPNK
ncbi:MAG TPA: hypothetical protein DEP18_04130 [Flavobacteriales bacterium]|nr:hypothetical protein [Flavobacteriales bacterium]HRE75644.1 hypothetical protein [Flavobacteriales bacterium]HRE96651.1 hypothetical protein [Flavobacteriales bacterium]HRJ36874.1 hypothetical protein [Flavobacteriales bacterium]HRJ39978.1 hypothetical protein [Flavobacteriales bacterium]